MLESTELFCRFRGSSFGFGDLGLMIQNCEIWYLELYFCCRTVIVGIIQWMDVDPFCLVCVKINIFRWMRLKRKACENEGLFVFFTSLSKWNRFVLSTYIYTACGKQVCRDCCKMLWPAHEALLSPSLHLSWFMVWARLQNMIRSVSLLHGCLQPHLSAKMCSKHQSWLFTCAAILFTFFPKAKHLKLTRSYLIPHWWIVKESRSHWDSNIFFLRGIFYYPFWNE